jgi:UDP-glucose:glycoprotein glucosyltransferase
VSLLINPLSKAAQKFSAMFKILQEHFEINYQLYLNPVLESKTMPLKTFYRFVLRDFNFDEKTGNLLSQSPLFENLPKKPLLTLALDTPESWFTEPIVAEDDLDNIRLEDTQTGSVTATFVLEHLLLSGQCVDLTNKGSPRGLQLVLGTSTQPHSQDTLVMANLAYFQLKANPGVSYLRLAEGRASEIYDLVAANGIKVRAGAGGVKEVPIYISDFAGSFISLQVQKKPGKEQEHLLVADGAGGEDEENLWDSFSELFNSEKKKDEKKNNNLVRVGENGDEVTETVHIFSIASGHLYERFLKIMMLSVLKNTKAPVKFWFLKNFLSPKFKVLPS